MQEICLKVKNIQSLDPHSTHYHFFDFRGGSIGSGSDNAWILSDKSHQIQNIQAVINFEEGIFGLKPYDKECKVFLNDSFSSLPYSYETQISIGDHFRIGEIEIEVMSPESFAQEQNKETSIDDLGELAPYENLDHIQSKNTEDIHLSTENSLDLEDDDILQLNSINDIHPSPAPKESDYFVSYQNVQAMIFQRAQKLQDQLPIKQSPTLHKEMLRMLDLESRIQHFSLLENKEILNLLVLSLLCESLQNPLFEKLYPNFFEKTLSEIIEECINGEGEMIQRALLAVLTLRSKNPNEE